MKKPIILLNALWLVIAGGTFYAGVLWRETQQVNSGASRAVKRVEAPSAPAALPGSGAMIKATSVSRDDDVLDFLKRYGLDSGATLTSETMKLAVGEALRETNPIKSQMLFARLMEELTPENAEAALAMLRENTAGFDSMRYMGMLAYAWGGVDPKAAMTALAEGEGRGGRMGQNVALSGWAAQDPKAAVAWLDAYQGEDKGWFTQSLINGLAKSDFDAALKYASGLADAGDKTRSAETLARELIRGGGVEKATSWFSSLTDPNMQRGAFEAVTQQLQRSNPEAAAEFIKQNAASEFAQNAVGNLAETIGREDVNKGLAFAASLPAQAQARAYGEIIGEWMDRNEGADSVAASQYVSQMPAGESRDAGASAIARRMAGEDPAAAIAWADSIGNTQQRQETLVDVGRRYYRTDPQAASVWLAQSGLSAEAQQQVTSPRGGGWDGPRGGWGGPGGRGPGGPGGGRRGR